MDVALCEQAENSPPKLVKLFSHTNWDGVPKKGSKGGRLPSILAITHRKDGGRTFHSGYAPENPDANERIVLCPYFKLLLYRGMSSVEKGCGRYQDALDISNQINLPVEGMVGKFLEELIAQVVREIARLPGNTVSFKFFIGAPETTPPEALRSLRNAVVDASKYSIPPRISVEVDTVSEPEAASIGVIQTLLEGVPEAHPMLAVGDCFTVVDAGGLTVVSLPWRWCPSLHSHSSNRHISRIWPPSM